MEIDLRGARFWPVWPCQPASEKAFTVNFTIAQHVCRERMYLVVAVSAEGANSDGSPSKASETEHAQDPLVHAGARQGMQASEDRTSSQSGIDEVDLGGCVLSERCLSTLIATQLAWLLRREEILLGSICSRET